ncbi:zinc finger protein Pegasus-like [Nelusetta ayraudi]|uniref:zinc finger protein Pegasus-like n=1 Tax=Nelusetta ayraudi TaxID=303726 RepID=UPI003F7213FB
MEIEEIKTEPVDFVREFQEYLTQQTHHVNMISGSVCGAKEPGEPFQAVAPKSGQNGRQLPSVEVNMPTEEGSDVQLDCLERTCDGKYKCSYCNYANKGIARLIEHIRTHTGEKPHRCQLCPFASAYERHLEAHMRSHTGEKPYKCDLCAFRCSDRSNLSHHRRRRHKILSSRIARSPFATKRMLSSMQKRTNSLGLGRRLPASVGLPKSDYLSDLSQTVHHHLSCEYENSSKVDENRASTALSNPLDQLSKLAGELADLQPQCETSTSPDRESLTEEKLVLTQEVYHEQTQSSTEVQTSPPLKDSPNSASGSCSPAQELSFEDSFTLREGNRPTDQQLLHKCQHCEVHFGDNILYTIHMGCHGYEHPFQCNICGQMCKDKYDFACHFARGQHHFKK